MSNPDMPSNSISLPSALADRKDTATATTANIATIDTAAATDTIATDIHGTPVSGSAVTDTGLMPNTSVKITEAVHRIVSDHEGRLIDPEPDGGMTIMERKMMLASKYQIFKRTNWFRVDSRTFPDGSKRADSLTAIWRSSNGTRCN